MFSVVISQLPNKFHGHFATPLECVISNLSDIDIIVPFENTTPINQNKKVKSKNMQSRLIRLIGVVFSNGTMLSALNESVSVNERTQEINESMRLHILEVWQYARKMATGSLHCP